MRNLSNASQWALLAGTELAVTEPDEGGRALTRTVLGKWLADLACLDEAPARVNDSPAVPRRAADWLRRRIEGRALMSGKLADLARQGIYVTTIFEDNYPRRLKDVLAADAPPILFYAGNLELASAARVAGFVGSRNASPASLEATHLLASSCATQKVTVCSGGARGIDQTSEDAILAVDGKMLMCPAEGLSHVVRKKRFRKPMADGRMLCVSMVEPDAGWHVRHAMERNALIYSLSTLVCVMHAEGAKGGTWTGATEALSRGNTVVASWAGIGAGQANEGLIRLGARPFHETDIGAVIRELRRQPASGEPQPGPAQPKSQQQATLLGEW